MSAGEFNVMHAYYKAFPFGDVREDFRSGMVASTIANVHRGKGTKPFLASDFILDFSAPKLSQDEIIKNKINSFIQDYK